MSGLIAYHQLAAARGDGLHPKLRELLEHRAMIEAEGSVVVEIGVLRGDDMVQAGPSPAARLPEFLPGNVVPIEMKARPASQARKKPAIG